jgi:ribosome-associated toxin RatA of RatAB toxin-antitoxin module
MTVRGRRYIAADRTDQGARHVGERVSDTTTIPATREQILDVILDLEAYPEWADGVKKVEVTEHDDAGRPLLARFVVDARVAEIDYVLRYDHSGEDLTWVLERGDVVRQLDGRYHFDEGDGTCTVHYSLEVDVTLPVPGFLKKRAAKVILDTGLRGLRQQVERQAGA